MPYFTIESIRQRAETTLSARGRQLSQTFASEQLSAESLSAKLPPVPEEPTAAPSAIFEFSCPIAPWTRSLCLGFTKRSLADLRSLRRYYLRPTIGSLEG